ncbi:MAG: N-acetylmuramoyl-L-alanine amidase-like domain-containing protein [Saprospiraceae bacterium]
MSECIIENASHFIGTPYVAGTLDESSKESLVCRSDGFDCVTFVEYILALSMYQTKGKYAGLAIPDIIQKLRYRNGEIEGYGSRIHYFTEWILQTEKSDILQNITSSLSKTVYDKQINFMSQHVSKYPKLTEKKEVDKIKKSESLINSKISFYIPKENIKNISQFLQNGDIIAITTNIAGLDFVHTGFIIWIDKNPHLIHASSDGGQVMITHESLSDYLKNNKSPSGIVVLRTNDTP